jgi:hypothetical protein
MLFSRETVLELIDELYSDVQFMRENGEGDLRSVLHSIDYLIRQIKELER